MYIIPAIDILNKKVVRLREGNYEQVTEYDVTLEEMIERYQSHGTDFIHVIDLARAIQFALEHFPIMLGKAYNVGSHEGTLTKLQLAQKIAALTGLTFEIDDKESDPDNRSYYVSFERIESIGFKTEFPFQHALEDTVDWLRSVGENQALIA